MKMLLARLVSLIAIACFVLPVFSAEFPAPGRVRGVSGGKSGKSGVR